MSFINYQSFNEFNNIAHFCTTRIGGVSVGNYSSFNISPFSGDNAENQNENLQILCKKFSIESDNIIFPFQTHDTVVKNIDETFFQLKKNERIEYLNGVDGLITSLQGICIGVTTADCVPIMYYDAVNKVIAVAHAGWRGTCGKIAAKTIEKMGTDFGCDPNDIFAVIGPSISQQVYNVGEEVLHAFEVAGFPVDIFFETRNNELFLDLWNANRWLLTESGIPEQQIEMAGICTFSENEKFFSARRLGIKSGRMLSGIMLK
ncbi:MAG TPA: peptidoglycan editing factor PgeF [Paludibacter sp.]|nr:peptidoglycan editing factor PgeF [Paludibacter sp.]